MILGRKIPDPENARVGGGQLRVERVAPNALGATRSTSEPVPASEMQGQPGLVETEHDAVAGDADDAQINQGALQSHREDAALLVIRLVDHEHLHFAELDQSAENQAARCLAEQGLI